MNSTAFNSSAQAAGIRSITGSPLVLWFWTRGFFISIFIPIERTLVKFFLNANPTYTGGAADCYDDHYPKTKEGPTMASIGSLTLTGKLGAKYEFEIYSFGTTFKNVPGVYAITKRDQNKSHSVIYIGQTGDMAQRHDDHHKEDCFTRNKANCISFHRDANEKSRLAKEADLIAAYNPPCNG